ncbi:MAG: hypothetical protein QW569_04000 [Candidatus Bathyarchaeia archaeon]|nr:hypothetical protein [Candidatus Bathyarchaeota archaeon]
MISEAAAKAKELNLSVCDACYVVVAEALAANLVTADAELHEKCVGEGLAPLLKDLGEEWRIQ